MNTPLIKICGVTKLEDIALCEELLIDYIGLNFVPSSPRCINTKTATQLRSASRRTVFVGVFENQPIDLVNDRATDARLDYVQLHGDESIEYAKQCRVPVIKAFRRVPLVDELYAWIDAGAKVLLDGRTNGGQADWQAVAALPRPVKNQLFLAGGLTPSNVAEATRLAHPFAVDVASGVESGAGVKDRELLAAFVSSVRGS